MISIFKSRVLDVKNQGEDIRFLKLSVPSDFEFRAGQYLSLSVLRQDGAKIRRPFSIVNASDEKSKNKEIEFCAKLISGGLASEFIRGLKVGQEVELFGPAGRFTIDSSKDEDLFFIASGVGIAPFVGMITDSLNKNHEGRIILLKSARTEKDSLYDEEFSELSGKHENFEFHNVFSQPRTPEGKSGNVGHVQDFLEKYVPKDFDGNFYICGLKEMIKETKEKLKALGFKEERMFDEKFD